MSRAPVRLADGVWRIPTLGSSAINSFALADDDGGLTLVDAGLKGAPKRLTTALSELGKRPSDVSRIVLTHAHPDHVGGAAAMRARTDSPVAIHGEDRAFLEQGRKPSPDPTQPLGKVFAFFSSRLPSCPVDATFAEGDLLDAGGGLRVLHTPGHSPGHCSFLHERSGVLITGDALFNFRNKVAWSMAALCSDFRMSQQTAERLGEVDYEIAAFTHGPEVRTGAREAIRDFLMRHRRRD
jgi:glyoxylase-like metal-dependent hydrolase (beta-lactamase superfamily II)